MCLANGPRRSHPKPRASPNKTNEYFELNGVCAESLWPCEPQLRLQPVIVGLEIGEGCIHGIETLFHIGAVFGDVSQLL